MRIPGRGSGRKLRSHLHFEELNSRQDVSPAKEETSHTQAKTVRCISDIEFTRSRIKGTLCGPCEDLAADVFAHYEDNTTAPSPGRALNIWIKAPGSERFILKNHHNDYKSLQKSSYNCRICHLLATTWYHTRGHQVHVNLKYRIQRDASADHAFSLWTQSMEFCASGCCSIFHDEFRRLRSFEPFRKRSGEPLEVSDVEALATQNDAKFVGKEVQMRSDSGICTEMILQWLNVCRLQHLHCSRNATPLLPKRVIDVRPPSGGEETRLHLSLYRESAPYIALSHCWGGRSPFCTTRENFEASKRSLKLQDYPRTFQDAVLLVRRLGYQYLWIDALCIIQDDPTDWNEQAESVGDIYRNAVLTISAMRAPDCNAGLFHPRYTTSAQFTSEDFSGSKLFLRQEYASSSDAVTGVLGPLSERAWVLQERLLSPAVLHFSRREIIWECRTQTLFEHGSKAKPQDYEVKLLLTTGQRSKSNRSTSPWRMSRKDRFKQWYKLVEIYSAKKLTFHDDRLPAIAGLARRFHAVCHSAYLAGLWEADLMRGLLWYIEYQDILEAPRGSHCSLHTPKGELCPYYTPSWSWASTRKCVSFNLQLASYVDKSNPKYTSTFTIHRCDIDTLNPRKQNLRSRRDTSKPLVFGHVMGGSLEVTGILRPNRLLRIPLTSIQKHWDRKPISKRRVWSLELGAWELESDLTTLNTKIIVFFLLLEPLDESGRDTVGYQRVGLAWCEWSSESRPDVQPKGHTTRVCII